MHEAVDFVASLLYVRRPGRRRRSSTFPDSAVEAIVTTAPARGRHGESQVHCGRVAAECWRPGLRLADGAHGLSRRARRGRPTRSSSCSAWRVRAASALVSPNYSSRAARPGAPARRFRGAVAAPVRAGGPRYSRPDGRPEGGARQPGNDPLHQLHNPAPSAPLIADRDGFGVSPYFCAVAANVRCRVVTL